MSPEFSIVSPEITDAEGNATYDLDICVVGLDGKDLVNVTANPGVDYWHEWCPVIPGPAH